MQSRCVVSKEFFNGILSILEIFDGFPGVSFIGVASDLFYCILHFSFYLYWWGRSRFLLIRELQTFVKCEMRLPHSFVHLSQCSLGLFSSLSHFCHEISSSLW